MYANVVLPSAKLMQQVEQYQANRGQSNGQYVQSPTANKQSYVAAPVQREAQHPASSASASWRSATTGKAPVIQRTYEHVIIQQPTAVVENPAPAPVVLPVRVRSRFASDEVSNNLGFTRW